MEEQIKRYYVQPIGIVTENNFLLKSGHKVRGQPRWQDLKVGQETLVSFTLSGNKSRELVRRVA